MRVHRFIWCNEMYALIVSCPLEEKQPLDALQGSCDVSSTTLSPSLPLSVIDVLYFGHNEVTTGRRSASPRRLGAMPKLDSGQNKYMATASPAGCHSLISRWSSHAYLHGAPGSGPVMEGRVLILLVHDPHSRSSLCHTHRSVREPNDWRSSTALRCVRPISAMYCIVQVQCFSPSSALVFMK